MIQAAWRKPKGIDNRVRRRFKGAPLMPSVQPEMNRLILQIGYGSNKKTRHLRPSGHKVFLVQNARDVDMLLMYNRTYVAEIGTLSLLVVLL